MADGEEADKIDQALTGFGMPMGPIELCDQIGLDVCFDVGQVLGMSQTASSVLHNKLSAGQLGRKSGSDFITGMTKKLFVPVQIIPRMSWRNFGFDFIGADGREMPLGSC